MPDTSDIRIPSFAAPVADPQVGDIYFDAVSISSEPTSRGSDEDFEVASNPITGGGSGGISLRQFTGSISVSDAGGEPTTAEYQSALSNVYSSSNPPQFGDLVSLQISGGTRLVARFWILNNDNVATTATIGFTVDGVSYVGLNLNYTSVEGLINGIQDYFAGPNGGQDPDGRDVFPTAVAPFAISVDGIYSTDAGGFLSPSDTASIRSESGDLQIKDGVSDSANGVDVSKSFSSGDGVRIFAIYLKAVVTFSNGTVSGVTATQELRETGTTNLTPVTDMDFNSAGTEGTKYWLVGTVELAKSGRRRFVRITQTMAGDVKSHAESTGTGSTVTGVDTDAGLREIRLCVNGDPYRTFILTGPLYEIT